MRDRLDLYFRAHTVPAKPQNEYPRDRPTKEPTHALIFHCVTTSDEKTQLIFGAYVCAELRGQDYVADEIGLFHRDGRPDERRILERFVKNSKFELATEEQFRRKVFLKYLKARQNIVAYDAPSQISRLAVLWNKSYKRRRAFSFYFREFRHKKTGKVRPSKFEPGLSIESLDASKAIYRLLKYKYLPVDGAIVEEEPASSVHILDLRTLTGAVTGEVVTLASACEIFGVPFIRIRKSIDRVTKPGIESLLKIVTGELELLNRISQEIARHPVGLGLERCFSPASLAKGYLAAVGVKPPRKKFTIPDEVNGIAMQSLAAGRAECNITRTVLPVTYVDFQAQFPAVSKLLNCRKILCAESLEFSDFTSVARKMTARATFENCFRAAFWQRLGWFALLEASEDVLPIRARFGQSQTSDPTLAWNLVTSKEPFWTTALDVMAAKMLTGKSPRILKAIKIIPHGIQGGLKPVQLHPELTINPLRDDLSVKLVQLRNLVKARNSKLAGGIKVAANSAAFGILCQVNVKDLDGPSSLHVFSGETKYWTPPAEVLEDPADFYCPVLASLVTGGSHLLCAMLERAVRDMGGHIAAMDTDSAMIVSTPDGGFIPCAGGPEKLDQYIVPSGYAAIRALSFDQVERIRKMFEALSPWRDTLGTPFLKLEKENLGPSGDRQQLYAYCVSAKLYCLFNLDGNRLLVRKPSGHGLGFLQAPYSIADWQRKTKRTWAEHLPPWIFEAWHFILAQELGLPDRSPRWLKYPAVMSVPFTTPKTLRKLGCFKDVLRPFSVVNVPFHEDEAGLFLKGYFVMAQVRKLEDLHGRPMVNVVSGATFFVHDKHSSHQRKPVGWLFVKTMEDEINLILARAESKFRTPDGIFCTSKTIGLLMRRHIAAGEFHYIGKEASTRWASGPDLSMLAEAGTLDPVDETFREYERVVDPNYLEQIRTEAKEFSTKLLSRQSRVAECAIRKFKNRQNTIKPHTLRKVTRAIRDLQNKTKSPPNSWLIVP